MIKVVFMSISLLLIGCDRPINGLPLVPSSMESVEYINTVEPLPVVLEASATAEG